MAAALLAFVAFLFGPALLAVADAPATEAQLQEAMQESSDTLTGSQTVPVHTKSFADGSLASGL